MPCPGTSLAGHDHCTLHDPCHDSACSLQGTALALATSVPSLGHGSCYCKLRARGKVGRSPRSTPEAPPWLLAGGRNAFVSATIKFWNSII